MTRALATLVCAFTLSGCLFRTAEAPRFYRPASAALDEDAGAVDASTSAPATAIR